MRTKSLLGLTLITILAACSRQEPDEPKTVTAEKAPAHVQLPAPGSDRDPHGCIPSAGYSWCAATNKCERPWELAKEKGLENTAAAFDAFCASPLKSVPPS